MYFNIIRRIKKYVIALLSMVVGFALAFMILGWKNKNAATFDDPLRGLVKALTMTIGEFDFDDLYGSFEVNTTGIPSAQNDIEMSAKTNRFFALTILVVLIMFGSIALLNLFVAVIISDFEKLHYECEKQNLVNMAQYSVNVEKIMPKFLLRKMTIEQKLFICLHDWCKDNGNGETCKGNIQGN